ncbi:hypothetical protein [Deinococcus sp. YIM 77859]|uniref:hypothetical protein n=1 Tax=Deinococcus sp. YIM 77859 TaxID=1540221 RepID=UPI000554CB88|nr:hypothetical protein [Deinococcus sp. YIM 77859]
MPRFQPPPFRPDVTPLRRSHLLAWPGVLTLLSVLAVLLGSPQPVADQGPRVTAGNVAPALPEVRPAPQPMPGPLLLTAAPPEPFGLVRVALAAAVALPAWSSPTPLRSLALLGRRQTDGG